MSELFQLFVQIGERISNDSIVWRVCR